jgi:hypothetical protein
VLVVANDVRDRAHGVVGIVSSDAVGDADPMSHGPTVAR